MVCVRQSLFEGYEPRLFYFIASFAFVLRPPFSGGRGNDVGLGPYPYYLIILEVIIISNTSRNLILSARVSADEKEIIERKAYESYRTVSTYLRECGLEKTIVSVRGLDVVATELRRIGNNINQLTRAVNSGQLYSINLYETQERLGELWQLLNMLILEAR